MQSHLTCARYVAGLLLYVLPTVSLAQEVNASAVVTDAQHQLLSAPLVGAGAAVRWPRADRRVTFRFGVDALRGRAERTGVPCAGLIRPGTCAPERVRDAARLITVDGSASIRLIDHGRTTLALDIGAVLGSVRADSRGLASGATLSARKSLGGAQVGAEVSWRPAAALPLELELGASAAALFPIRKDQIVDGYTPFENDLNLARIRLGVGWRPLAQRK